MAMTLEGSSYLGEGCHRDQTERGVREAIAAFSVEGVDLVAQFELSAEWNSAGSLLNARHDVEEWSSGSVNVFGAEGEEEMDGKDVQRNIANPKVEQHILCPAVRINGPR